MSDWKEAAQSDVMHMIFNNANSLDKAVSEVVEYLATIREEAKRETYDKAYNNGFEDGQRYERGDGISQNEANRKKLNVINGIDESSSEEEK